MMIPSVVIYFAVQIIFSTLAKEISNIRFNSLLSAQCKARCLHQYRTDQYHPRTQTNIFPEDNIRRTLGNNGLTLPWRSTWERCPRLLVCSSCLLPCDLEPLLLLSNDETCQAICSTLKMNECQGSCQFIRDLYQREMHCLTNDCKSCSTSNNCSEKIPRVYNVSISERKSRRTVKLKWNSIGGLDQDEPIFYVIEAQWTIPKTDQNQYEMISKWGFVKEEVSHTKAIIRNIQRDQRWYLFRIAAVTRHGSSAYVTTNKPFRLSNPSEKYVPFVEAPKNFSIVNVEHNMNTINVTLSWSKSESPVDIYQISWQSDNDQSSDIQTVELSSSELIVPYLSVEKSYLFKIRSIIITNGNQKQMSLPQLLHFHPDQDIYSMKNIELSAAYFTNGLIKANLSWTINDDFNVKQYDLSWIESQCYSDIFSCCYRRDAVTIQNSFQLYDLRFNCTYIVNIKPIRHDSSSNKSFQWYFNVSSCPSINVQGSIVPPCGKDRKTIDLFSSLPPMNLLVTRNQSGWNFFWQTIHSSIDELQYQLIVEQWPNRRFLLSQNFSTMTNRYFLPFNFLSKNIYLNVSLTLMDENEIRQEQSILIDQRNDESFDFQSSIGSKCSRSSLLIVFLKTFNCFR